MDLFRLTVNKFEEIAQLLIIRRFILFIKENKLKLAFFRHYKLVIYYAIFFRHWKTLFNENFRLDASFT